MNAVAGVSAPLLMWVVAALSAVVFLPFGWAVKGHFARHGGLPRGMALLTAASVLAYCCMVVVLAVRSRPASEILSFLAAVAMIAAGALFWWTIATTRGQRLNLAHSGRQSDHIQSAGPYRWVRHPFYSAYMLFWIGTALLAGGWQWVPVLMLIGWYVLVARGEEQQFLSSGLATTYSAYRSRTGMLVPRIRPDGRGGRC